MNKEQKIQEIMYKVVGLSEASQNFGNVERLFPQPTVNKFGFKEDYHTYQEIRANALVQVAKRIHSRQEEIENVLGRYIPDDEVVSRDYLIEALDAIDKALTDTPLQGSALIEHVLGVIAGYYPQVSDNE